MVDSEHYHVHMDRDIFKLNLPVMVTSAYILIAALSEQNIRPSLDEIRSRWTKSDEDLKASLDELVRRNIARRQNAPDGTPLYLPNPSSLWR